jgi:hypothetical protein
MLKTGESGRQAFINLAQSVASAEAPVVRLKTLMGDFGRTLGNTLRYQFSTSIYQGISTAISNAYNYAQDLNESLNNIRIVTEYSAEEMDKFAEKANKAAKALNTTTTAYTDASLIYFQ